MKFRLLLLLLVLALLAPAGTRPNAAGVQSQADLLCERAYALAYNLDFPEAIATFQQAVGAQPNDPQGYRGLATVTWLSILFRRGAVTVDDYMGHVSTEDQKVDLPPPAESNRFWTNAQRALAIGEEELRRNPRSAAAHYDVGAAVGLMATYSATVEGHVLGGLRAARRAYSEQDEALSLDPKRKDAGLVVGTYRYIVGSLPIYARWLAYVVGFGGDRELGLRMIEEAATYRGDAQADAKFALVLIYNRERRYDDALKIIRELQARFPRNRVLWLEAGATALRAGRAADAEAELNAGIDRLPHDPRPRSFGEEALWRYKRGVARVLLGNMPGAEEDLRASLSLKGQIWVQGRAHTELGKLADTAGQRSRAMGHYQAAVTLGDKANDDVGVAQAKALIATPYGKKR